MAALLFIMLMVSRNGFVMADTANNISLTISQLKITSSNGQFITLYNSSNTALDMSKYQLQYFNSYDLTKATSSKLIPLSGTVPSHGYFMVNDSALLLCYQLTVDSVSLGFSSTAGLVEVLGFNQASPGGAVAPVLQDYVGWSKSAANGAQTLPASSGAFLQRLPTDSSNNPSVKSPGAGSWQTVQPDDNNACNLTTSTGSSLPIPSGLGQLLPSTEPPASIVSVAPGSTSNTSPATMPASDIGLMAPQVTELLPNPAGTGNDSTDEYIELYNSNSAAFDLSGFVLQSGLTTTHNYTFPSGSMLDAHSFKAFYSEATSLSLSNTSGQVKLLDPLGNSISATDTYANAKEGQTWSLAKGKWYWTTEPTPNKPNVIKQAASAKKPTAKSKTGSTKVGNSTAQFTSGGTDEPSIVPIHTRTLALVIGLAILYGVYEYRVDARNKLYQLRRYLGVGQSDRQQAKRQRSD
jgi:hypothetical protein